MKKSKAALILSGVLFMSALIMLYPKASCEGAGKGLDFCAKVLIPSLFPFMIISGFVVKSGISVIIGKIGGGITKLLFRLPGVTFATVIISLIGGYPTGAKGISSLVEGGSITKKQAELMMLFCVGAGPGFVINAVGCSMFGNIDIGVILFASQILASLAIGVICSLFYRKTFTVELKDIRSKRRDTDNKEVGISKALINSVSESIISILNMCGFVVLFSCLIEVLTASGFIEFISGLLNIFLIPASVSNSIVPVILEVTTGCKTAISLNAPIEIVAFALGFSGLCVHFQIFSIINVNISKAKFILARLAHGLVSAFNTYMLLKIFPIAEPVSFSTGSYSKLDFSLNVIGVVSLMLMSAIFLLSLREETVDV